MCARYQERSGIDVSNGSLSALCFSFFRTRGHSAGRLTKRSLDGNASNPEGAPRIGTGGARCSASWPMT